MATRSKPRRRNVARRASPAGRITAGPATKKKKKRKLKGWGRKKTTTTKKKRAPLVTRTGTRKKRKKTVRKKTTRKKATRKKSTRKRKDPKRVEAGKKAARTRKRRGRTTTRTRKAARRPSRKTTRKKAARTRKRRKVPRKFKGFVYSAPRAKAARRAKKKVGRKVHTTARYGYRVSTRRRKAGSRTGRLSKQGRVNPHRKRRRRNPGFLSVIRETVTSVNLWRSAGQGLLGFSAATVIPGAIETASMGRVSNSGYTGVGLSALSTGLATVAALWVERRFSNKWTRMAAKNVAVGGLMATTIRGLFAVAPQVAEFLKLSPIREPMVSVPGVAGLGSWLELRGMDGLGQGSYRLPMDALMSGMGGGMGNLPSANEALIAGESMSRATRQMDGLGDMGNFLELRGLGSGYPGQYGGGYDPYGAGVSGLGDWVGTINPATAAGQQALAATAWQPSAAEVF